MSQEKVRIVPTWLRPSTGGIGKARLRESIPHRVGSSERGSSVVNGLGDSTSCMSTAPDWNQMLDLERL